MYLFAVDGKRYLDFASGIAVNALGHCHPHITSALKSQADTLWHCSNMYRMEGLERLAERFTKHTFADKIFFCNSGSEAVECGLKMLRKYHDATDNPDKYRVITMTGGFHGRTLACISAGGNDVARAGYAPLLDGFDRAEFNNLASVKTAITPQTAAILVEPIQGEGGVHVATKEFLQGLRKLCDEYGLLLFIDEVQCGMGRTGYLFAHEMAGIKPDIVSVAKGIGNGFPLAACLMTDAVASAVTPGSHGSTYGSNPLAMAVGNAVLDVMLADGFLQHVQHIGALLRQRLSELAATFPTMISEVRGHGLMLGIKTVKPAREFAEYLRTLGLFTAPAEDSVIRILPPLIITEANVEEAIQILTRACKEYA